MASEGKQITAKYDSEVEFYDSVAIYTTEEINAEIRAQSVQAFAELVLSGAKLGPGRMLAEAILTFEGAIRKAAGHVSVQTIRAKALAEMKDVHARDPAYYVNHQLNWEMVFNEALDNSTDFFVAWADQLTDGNYTRVFQNTGYLRFVDPTSTAYAAGDMVGAVHVMALEVAMPYNCNAGRLISIARNLQRARDAFSFGQAVHKWSTQGTANMGLTDWLAIAAPAMSMRRSKCFTEGHRIVVLGDGDTLAMVDVEGREVRWAVGLLAVGGMLHLIRNRTLVEGSNQRRSRRNRREWDEVIV